MPSFFAPFIEVLELHSKDRCLDGIESEVTADNLIEITAICAVLAENFGKRLDDIEGNLRLSLRERGMTPDEWDLIRQTQTTDHKGARVFTIDQLMAREDRRRGHCQVRRRLLQPHTARHVEEDVEVLHDKMDDADIEDAESSPVVRYVNHIIQTAAKEGAREVGREQ